MNRVKALIWKDLRIFFGDRKAMLITFLVPIGIVSFFASIFGGTSGGDLASKKIPVLVVDNDQSPLTSKIVEGLKKDSMADPKVVSLTKADQAVKSGKSAVAIVFPHGFGHDAPAAMFHGEPPVVDVRFDPSKNLEMQAVRGSIMQVTMQTVAGQTFSGPPMKPPFTLKSSPQTAVNKGEDDYSQVAHSFAGMAMQGVLFFGINAAMAILRDRRLGIWRRLRASPITLTELLLGKTLSIALIAVFVLAGVLGFGMAAFGMRVSGSWLGLGLVMMASALMVSGFGLLVASLGRTEEQSRGLSILAVLAMVMLGGAWFPSFMMPGWVQTLSLLIPVRWALDGFDGMLWRGQTLVDALTPTAGLLAFTLVFALIAAYRFKSIPETA